MNANIGFLLCTALLVGLTGCVGYVDGPRAHYRYVEPVYVEQDDFVYYPHYGMYYGSRSHQYYYQDGRSWVARPAPRGVSVNLLVSTPSVAVDFHDGPASHHAQVARTYPKNWKPDHGNNGRHESQR